MKDAPKSSEQGEVSYPHHSFITLLAWEFLSEKQDQNLSVSSAAAEQMDVPSGL